MKNFFEETNGEVYVTEGICQLYTMSVKDTTPLVFTEAFENTLKGLDFSSKLPENDPVSNTIFKRFVDEYGTFYVSEVSMGARFWIESRFESKASSNEEITNRMECVSKSINKGKDM